MPDAAKLFPLALVVMVVDLLESTSIARALAAKCKYELNANQVGSTQERRDPRRGVSVGGGVRGCVGR